MGPDDADGGGEVGVCGEGGSPVGRRGKGRAFSADKLDVSSLGVIKAELEGFEEVFWGVVHLGKGGGLLRKGSRDLEDEGKGVGGLDRGVEEEGRNGWKRAFWERSGEKQRYD
jgi:hypothetical protein